MLTHLLPTTPLDLLLHLSLAGLLLLTLSTLLTTTLLRRSSAAARHLTWTAACLALLCLPAFSLLPTNDHLPPYLAPLPRLTASLPAFPTSPLPTSPPSALPTTPHFTFHVFTSSRFLPPLYTLGLLTSLTPLLLSPLLLLRLKRRATIATDESLLSTLDDCRSTLGLTRPTTLLLSPSPTAMPLTFGLLRPHILLPSTAPTWPPDKLRLVLSHELAHIKRHDCLTLCLAQLARALHWFNPLSHLAVRRMLAERERACDDLVLRATQTLPSDYANTLLHLTASLRPAPALLPVMPMARPSHLHTRLLAILNPALNRSPLSRRLTLAILLLTPLLTLPLACTPHAKKSEPPSAETPPTPALSDQTVDQYGWTPEMNACQGQMRDIALAASNYAAHHDHHLPPTLGDTLPHLDRNHAMSRTDRRHATPAEKARMYLDPRDYASVSLPDTPTYDWVNAHTSYTYLGRPDVNLNSLTSDQYGNTILLHDNLTHPHHHPKHGPTIICAYLDGHAEAFPLDMAKQKIAESQRTLAAAAKKTAESAAGPNAPWPADLTACARNLRDLSAALLDYADTHDRHYPPDLGPTVDFIARRAAQSAPDHRPPTPTELAHKFLCPLRAPTAFIPDQVSADWVRFNSTYTYLGSDKISVGNFTEDQWDHTVILHDDLDHPHHHPYFGTVTIVAYLNGSAQLLPTDEARKQIATSKQTLAVIDYRKLKALQNRTPHAPNPRHSTTSPLSPQS